MIRRSKRGYWDEEWLARRIPATIGAMLLTGIALATLPGDEREARKPDPSPASSAAAPVVAPDAHGLDLLQAHRRVVHGNWAPLLPIDFVQSVKESE